MLTGHCITEQKVQVPKALPDLQCRLYTPTEQRKKTPGMTRGLLTMYRIFKHFNDHL